MRFPHIIVALLLSLGFTACAGPAREEAPDRPRLVVMVVVDQLRGDLIDRYADAFDGGFVRLMEEGAVWTGASHRHASTSTAIGHATLSTGVHPTRHGIVGNSWNEVMEDGSLRGVYAVEDSLSPLVGFAGAEGRSPANILRTGLADWMLEADPRTQVVAISSKDRGAIPMAGQTRGHVYWLAGGEGRFATSTYYRSANPGWVERFNRERMPEIVGDSVWNYEVPGAHDDLARRDAFQYEGDGEHTTFPHERAAEASGDLPRAQYSWAGRTPAADQATLELTLAALDELALGQGEQTDFLAISFSATDYVGHGYGPESKEQLDNLTRLDDLLGQLMTALDERVGEGNWVLGLSADHGVVSIPEWRAELGLPGYRTTAEDFAQLQATIDEVESSMEGASREEIGVALAEAIETFEWVADVMVPSELAAPSPDSMINLYANSWSPDRHWGLVPEYGLHVRHTEGSYVTGSATGTGHGSPYWYDRHVPFVLIGHGVSAGLHADAVYTVDMAPTLAGLAGITPPGDLDGRHLLR